MKKWLNEGSLGTTLVILSPVVFGLAEGFDHQVANLLFVLLGFLGITFLFIWIVRTYVRAWWKRLALLGGVLAVGFLFLSQLEFRGFSGELIPQFRWKSKSRIAVTKTQAAVTKQSPVDAVDEPNGLKDVSPKVGKQAASIIAARFTQFMGESRDGKVVHESLSTDWQKEPPSKVWEIDVGAAWSGFVVADGLAVTQEQYDGKDAVSAFDLENGNLVWRSLADRKHYHPMGGAGPRATPTIIEGLVIAQSSTGIVTSMDLTTGKLNWSVDLLSKAEIDQASAEAAVSWGRSGSPLILNDLVVVPLGAGSTRKAGTDAASLIALDLETGEEKWRVGSTQISYASPALMTVAGKEQIVIVNESDVTGHEVLTGAVLWRVEWPGASNGGASVSQATQLDDQHLLLSKGYGGGAKVIKFKSPFDVSAAIETVWSDTSVMKTKFMSPVVLGEYVYGLSDGILECISWRDGKRVWKDGRQGRLGHGQILLVGNQLLCCSEDGRLVLTTASPTKPDRYASIAVLEGVTWNPLALAGDFVLMRNAEKVACLKVSAQP